MYKKIPHQNYIYKSGKPEMSLGDSSLDSESFNEIEEQPKKENNIIISENYFEIPKENEIPPIHIPFNDQELFPQNKQYICYCSATKDTERGVIRRNTNNKEDNFSIKKQFNLTKENNRYSNINLICQNNCRFLNSLQDENDNEDEDIVNNEISVNFIEEIINDNDNNNDKIKKGNQVEILLDNNISKIYSNSDISNNNINNNNNMNKVNNDKINEIKKENLIKKNEISENIKKIIQNINKNKFEWNNRKEEIKNNDVNIGNKDNNSSQYFAENSENKENLIRNGNYDTEVNINLNKMKMKNGNNEDMSQINKSKMKNCKNDINKNLNSIFFELKNNKSNVISLSKSKSSKKSAFIKKRFKAILNQTKKYKIFQNFLSVSIDTSILYTLDDDMNSLLLNPKITYNYPYNNLEKDLE